MGENGLVFPLSEGGGQDIVSVGVDLFAAQEVPFVGGNAPDDLMELLDRAGLKYAAHYELSRAYNREPMVKSGLLLASRWPISEVARRLFENPDLVARVDGAMWESDDKGYIVATLEAAGISVSFTCTHLLPFANFGVTMDSPQAIASWSALELHAEESVRRTDITIIAGDFNRNARTLGPLDSASYGMETRDSRAAVDAIFVPRGISVGPVWTIPTRSDHHLLIGDFECSISVPTA